MSKLTLLSIMQMSVPYLILYVSFFSFCRILLLKTVCEAHLGLIFFNLHFLQSLYPVSCGDFFLHNCPNRKQRVSLVTSVQYVNQVICGLLRESTLQFASYKILKFPRAVVTHCSKNVFQLNAVFGLFTNKRERR